MANLISVERARLALGTAQVLDDVSLGLGEGDRVGIVGRNGGGKSTLLKVLSGERTLDDGRVTYAGHTRVGMLTQDDTLDPASTVAEVVLGDRAEHEWAGDSRIRDVLTGLLGGLEAPAIGGLDATVGPMSGGERRRLALAKVLVDDPEVLLLDEPTNHLDVEGVAWLADHLVRRWARPDRSLATITHDRWFLDAVAEHTWEVVDGRVEQYEGGYAAYVLAKAERERIARVTAERRDNLLRKELAWLQRGAPARTSKPKFRIDAANALIADEPPPRDGVELVRFATTRLGKDVIDLLDASVEVGGRELLSRITWHLGPGDRVGIVGVNGAGKSTLLRVLAGTVPIASGKRKQGITVRIGHLTQEVGELERFADSTVIQAVEDVRQVTTLGKKEVTASQLAKRLGFSGGRQQTRVRDLSGGERRRLQILRLLMDEPNVLLLDEPTNDLDIETLTQLEDVLDGWAGTLLVVSHDRYLLERLSDRQIALLGDGRIRDLPGGVAQYLQLRSQQPAATPTKGAAASPSPAPAEPAVDPAAQREARKAMARIEKQLTRLSEREDKLHHQMADAVHDHTKLAELNASLGDLAEEKEALEMEWLEAAELVG